MNPLHPTAHSASAKNRLYLLVAMLFALLVVGPPRLLAQETAEVSGTVTDPSGAIISGAKVTVRNQGTNASRDASSNNSGIYSFTNLQPGRYTITVSSGGFAPFKAALDVTVGGRFTTDAKLSVNDANTSVEVTSDVTAQVNTQTPEVSQVINQEQLSALPSLTRNPYDFVALSGNISNGDNTAAGNVQNGSNRGVNFSLNGQRNSGTEILLDGVENLTVFSDALGMQVPLDGVQEYRIITNNFSPEYGRASGGVVNVATKSGTNTFHGGLWEFNRLSATTANTVTNAQTGTPKGIYTRNQFGGAAGGPIKKDKLFFFGAVEFTRVRSASSTISAIPTPQLLAYTATVPGNNIASFFNQYAGTNTYNVVSTTTNLQAGSGTTPLYSQLAPGFPVFNDVSYTAPVDAGGGLPQNTYNVLGRVDYTLGEKTQMFYRYVNYHEIDQQGAVFASPYAQYDVAGSNIGQTNLLSIAHEFTSNFASITKLSFTRVTVANSYNTALQNVPTLNIAPNAADPYTTKTFQLPGFYDENPANGGLPYGGPQNTSQINEDLNYTRGRHQIQLGTQLLYIQMNQAYGAYAQASEQLGSSQAKGLQALLTGNLYEFEAAVNPKGATPCYKNQYTGALTQTTACTINLPAVPPPFARSDRYKDWAIYGQDQWKLTPQFVLNYGVRYEHFGVQHNDNPNLDSNFVYGSGSNLYQQIRSGSILTVPQSPVGGLWHPQWGTVSPRVGFALDVFGDGRTSLRGGYGISYERNFGNITFNIIQNPPNYAVVVLTGSATTPIPVTNSNTGPLAGGPGLPTAVALPPTSGRAVDQNIRTAQTQFRSMSIDQQLGRGTVLEISYNGARGVHLYDIKNYNGLGSGNALLGDPVTDPVSGMSAATRLNPYYSNINNRGSNGDSYYDAVNFQFQTQDIHHSGLSIVANYTFAHALDDLSTAFSEDASGDFQLGYTNPFNPSLDHGSSDFDIRQRFVLAPIYRTPSFFKDKGGALAQLLGGYELTGIYTVRTGTPFTIYDSTENLSGYNVVRYNPVTPVTNHVFKSIPKGAQDSGNSYQLTSGANGQTVGTALPQDKPFANALFAAINPSSTPGIPSGISDWGPYPATMTARNIFRGPGAYDLNVSIAKTFPIHERLNLELRAEGYDVTNHHNLYIQQSQDDAANSINAGTTPQILASKGGVAGGANDERRFLQFAGKINF